MSSPGIIPISQFIHLDKRKSDPIYLQIAYQFVNAVQRGLLHEGAKVPGTRIWSDVLGVHRKTITAAFEELETQNWLEIYPRVGAFVKNPQSKKEKDHETFFKAKSLENAVFPFRKTFILNSPFEKEDCQFAFNDGVPDYRWIKTQELARFYTATLKRKNTQNHIGNYAIQENEFFKEHLCYYLNLTRGFHFSPGRVLTAKSKELLFYTIAQLLIQEGKVMLVGELSHFSVNMIFGEKGASIQTIPIDQHGIDVEYIQTHYKKGEISGVYLNPQCDYPTTVSLSRERRKKLLALSEEYDFVIIEDMEDFDFHYEKEQALPLAVQDNSGRVIHLGTIGKYLTPNFHLSFMLGPLDFIAEAKKHISMLQPQGNFVLEQALGEMIVEGDLFRYQKKSLKIYKERRNAFATLLTDNLKDEVTFYVPAGGLAFWLEFKNRFSLLSLAKETQKHDLFIPRICMYQDGKRQALRLGYANFTEVEMKDALRLLKERLNECI